MSAKKIVTVIVCSIVVVGLVGAYLLFKEAQSKYLEYNLVILNEVFDSGGEGESYKKTINDLLNIAGNDDDMSTAISKVDELFKDKDFVRSLYKNLRKIDIMDGKEDVDSWDLLLTEHDPEKLKKVWSVLVQTSILRLEEGEGLARISTDQFRAIKYQLNTDSK